MKLSVTKKISGMGAAMIYNSDVIFYFYLGGEIKIPEIKIKEWVWSKPNPYQRPEVIRAEPLGWGVPTIQRLWFGYVLFFILILKFNVKQYFNVEHTFWMMLNMNDSILCLSVVQLWMTKEDDFGPILHV